MDSSREGNVEDYRFGLVVRVVNEVEEVVEF
jgi:hypothetical protein